MAAMRWIPAGIVLLLLGCGGSAQREGEGVTAFMGATIFDGVEPIDDGLMLVKDGMVMALGPAGTFDIPQGAKLVDLKGRFVTPGLITGHAHPGGSVGLDSSPELYTEENIISDLKLYARYGVTTVANLGGPGPQGLAVQDAEKTPAIGRARLVDAGVIVTGPTPDEARAQVDSNADLGVDLIKIRVDSFLGTREKMAPETYKAVIEEAHKKGLPVAAHLYYLEDAKGLLDAGVDYIAHSVRDQEVDEALIAELKERNVCVCPTLTREVSSYVYESTPEFFNDPFFLETATPAVLEELQKPERQQAIQQDKAAQSYKQALAMAETNLKKLEDGGVRIVFGTDSGPAARFEGYFEHMELQLMADAGLTPEQILRSATSDAANCLGLPKVGILEPGRFADFVVFGKSLLDDVGNSRTIESVWVGGAEIER
ncbi:MAG: amidohydrolase family protein [Acidobacteria bacterium]|nr:amidohydrolase family protein [Acidobacteriota bacterium]